MKAFTSPNILELVEASKLFWGVCAKSNLKALQEPSAHPEFSNFRARLAEVTFNDFCESPEFKSKLFATGSAEYCDIYKDPSIHIMAIFMPPKLVYPIHDHPEMLAISKILKGKAVVSYYDIIDAGIFYKDLPKLNFSKLSGRLARAVALQENDMECLLPHKANLHSFESQQRTVILDVMFNYYDDQERQCSFFELGAPVGGDVFELFYHREDF